MLSAEKLKFKCDWREAGEPSPYVWLFNHAWLELTELHCRTQQEYVQRVTAQAYEHSRYETAAFYRDNPVGVAVFAFEDDVHVGDCLSVMHQYVLPEYRNLGASKGFMRALLVAAKLNDVPNVAFSHRIRPGVYNLIYRNVRHGQDIEEDRQSRRQG